MSINNWLPQGSSTIEDVTPKSEAQTDFYGNPIPAAKENRRLEPHECSSHDWVDVVLFHTTQERCKWCDVKKAL